VAGNGGRIPFSASNKGHAVKALIVDDSATMRAVLRKILAPMGFEIAEARNGREGLERFDDYPVPDLALVDWHMPEMDGFALLKEVRSRSDLNEVIFVMVTAENELTQINEALGAGANEYVMKPLTAAIVTEKLQMLGF
jgi:two-component system chemotaxis response regulator CheY